MMRYALAILLLCAPAYGAIVNEVEPNDTTATATPIPQSAFGNPVNFGVPLPTATLLGQVEAGRPDVDYFSFFGYAGDRLVVDADTLSLPGRSNDLVLRLLLGSQLLVSVDDWCGSPLDDPDSFCHDPAIGLNTPYVLPATGTYFIDVHGLSNASPGNYLVHVSKSIPEPSTLALLATGVLLFGFRALRAL